MYVVTSHVANVHVTADYRTQYLWISLIECVKFGVVYFLFVFARLIDSRSAGYNFVSLLFGFVVTQCKGVNSVRFVSIFVLYLNYTSNVIYIWPCKSDEAWPYSRWTEWKHVMLLWWRINKETFDWWSGERTMIGLFIPFMCKLHETY